MNHPIQPLITDAKGVIRFKQNAIVRHLLDKGGINLNDIAALDFSIEDHAQFAQLIGYSWSGAWDLGYLSEEILNAANEMHDHGISEIEARSNYLRSELDNLRDALREPIARLYRMHPEDLRGNDE